MMEDNMSAQYRVGYDNYDTYDEALGEAKQRSISGRGSPTKIYRLYETVVAKIVDDKVLSAIL